MANLWTIYRREMKSYFTSPVAYIFICAFLVFMSVFFFFFTPFLRSDNPDLRLYFFLLPFTYALLIPAVTMRLWSEEKRAGTVEMLMTLPLRSWEVVLGKFLAGYTIMAITILLTLCLPLSVSLVLSLDWGVIFASYIGVFLLAGVYVAVGTWASALTQNQIVAFLVALVILFLLAGIGLAPVMDSLNKFLPALGLGKLGWFGTSYHAENFQKGLLNPVDLVYVASMMAFFLILNNFAVEWRKY
jgi:ABC-2 type transport system permease protein